MLLGRCLEISELFKWLNMSLTMTLLVEWTQTDGLDRQGQIQSLERGGGGGGCTLLKI